LLPTFFGAYIRARLLDGEDKQHGDASSVFEEALLSNLRRSLSAEALATPVLFTDQLSNRVLAVHLALRDGSTFIAVNVRMKIDPEMLAHTLVEEYVHAQQVLDGVDFAAQRQQFPDYASRPYEQEAKRIASELLGYTPEEYTVYLLREEPAGVFYDRPAR
jgi:hypothetical protein